MNQPRAVGRLGVDIGGVIIDKVNDRSDTSFFGPNFLQTTAVPEVVDCLARCRKAGWEIHLVSKCGAKVQQKSRLWLEHHRFFEQTGIPAQNLHFCLTRPEKAPIARRLQLTHFVDDRLDVLEHLQDLPSIERLILFQPNPDDKARWSRNAHGDGPWTNKVGLSLDWSDALSKILMG